MTPTTPDTAPSACPWCDSPLVRRIVRQPPHTGIGIAFQPPAETDDVWKCTNPACDYQRSVLADR